MKLGTEGAYPPFNLIDASGQVGGFDVEIGQALCAKMKTECEVVTSDWDGIIPALNAKKFDFLIASMSITDERKAAVDFTEPYYTNKLQFIAPKGSDFKTDKASLQGQGHRRPARHHRRHLAGRQPRWRRRYQACTTPRKTPTSTSPRAALDGVLADTFVNWEWLKSDAGKAFEFKGDPVFDNDKIGIAVRKGDALRDKLNAALAEIVADGTYKQINDKYFPFSIY